jgi:hypothetical protein
MLPCMGIKLLTNFLSFDLARHFKPAQVLPVQSSLPSQMERCSPDLLLGAKLPTKLFEVPRARDRAVRN